MTSTRVSRSQNQYPRCHIENISPLDWGPIYKETIYGRWPVEPFNTLTTLFFLALVVYWALKVGDNWRKHRLLTTCLPLIALGFVGGFLYHSFRNRALWLILDWGPIVACAIVCAAFYWRTLLSSWWQSLSAALLPLALMGLSTVLFEIPYRFMSLAYPVLIVGLLVPLAETIRKGLVPNTRFLKLAVGSVLLALALRFLDQSHATDFLPMGSHFLWHSFGALTCHFFCAHCYSNPIRFKEANHNF